MDGINQPLAQLQVLLVEDEMDIADLLLWILEDAGAQVRLVNSAEEALELLQEYQPDLLVCDIKLPNQEGDWLIRQIRAQRQRNFPAIAVTSYDREVSRQKMLDAGFQCFLKRPLDPDHLIAEILDLIRNNPLGGDLNPRRSSL